MAEYPSLPILRADGTFHAIGTGVRDVMTPVIHHVAATAAVADAARIMVDRHIHRLVVTQGRQPVGMVTSMDLLRVLAEQP